MLLTSTLSNALSAQLAACANYFLISNWAVHGAHSGTALHFLHTSHNQLRWCSCLYRSSRFSLAQHPSSSSSCSSVSSWPSRSFSPRRKFAVICHRELTVSFVLVVFFPEGNKSACQRRQTSDQAGLVQRSSSSLN